MGIRWDLRYCCTIPDLAITELDTLGQSKARYRHTPVLLMLSLLGAALGLFLETVVMVCPVTSKVKLVAYSGFGY